MYAGVIERFPPQYPQGVYCGHMLDDFGPAIIENVWLTEDQLRFRKRYERRDDVIEYSFTRQEDGTWAGEYSGEKTGRGYSRCILTLVPAAFFAPRAKDINTDATDDSWRSG